ncbi:Inner membrane amino-acid ABC transporter permease protein YecS (plasmid) [Variovorax sp. SRS16]|uniref:amino acid ABC transporter permease n=1 Tax=Variovorax sp. SRS16 TaxID=282217 RepID=UPI00131958C2|nr:amino acid ABC transporter permease [Variovorax sp. SRS16]VTU46543.1 Inner membrane amino-acid ABC transporter permease protein YecS [Variovorax sp. SRS16]
MNYTLDFAVLLPHWEQFAQGCWLTLRLSALAIVIGLVVGLLTLLGKRSSIAPLRWFAEVYVEIVRNTPFLVQVLFIFFGLPSIGISLTPNTAAVLALSLNLGAFSAEIIRTGVESVPRGQFEAGAALGLSPFRTFRHIVLKPALRTIYPSLAGQLVMLLLTTSIVSSISAEELTSVAQNIDSATFRSFEVYIVAALLYLAMSTIFSTVFKAIDRLYFAYPTK